MRLIDADLFKENIISGLYVFCQENKEDICDAIDCEPTVEAVDFEYHSKLIKQAYQKGKDIRAQGEWKYETKFDGIGWWYCSNCYEHKEWIGKNSNFCPNCGAEMKKGSTK